MITLDRHLISTARSHLIFFLGFIGLFMAANTQAQAQSAACNAVNLQGAFTFTNALSPSTSSILTNWIVGEVLTVSMSSLDGISRSDGLFRGPTFAVGTFGPFVTTAVPAIGTVTFTHTITLSDLANGIAIDPENDDAVVVACGGPPSVTNVSPNAGLPAGGATVVITGKNFSVANTSVTFGGVPATSFTVNSSTQITATVPADGVGDAQVVVSTLAGSSASGSSVTYDYTSTPGTDVFFVSGENGADAGTCPQTAPCRTLNYALQLASSGSTIQIKDSGSFGPIYVTHGITINGPAGNSASIVWAPVLPGCVGAGIGNCTGNSGANYAVEIVAGITDTVSLNNLVIDNGAGSSGAVHIGSAAAVYMTGNSLRGGTGGIPQLLLMDTSQGSLMQLMFDNCEFSSSQSGGGIFLDPGSPVSLNLSNSQVYNLKFGVKVNTASLATGSSVNAVIDNSELFGFVTNGVVLNALSGGNANAVISRSTISQAAGDAVYINGATATALFYQDVIGQSATGIQFATGSMGVTFGNNGIFGPGANINGGSLSPAPAGVGGIRQ
jgi:IPT/TIG domain